MKDLIYILLSSFIGSGIAGVFLYFIITKWLGTSIEQSIKHEYDRTLEEFKTSLALEQNELISKRVREFNADSKLMTEFLHDCPPDGYIQSIKNAAGRIFHVDLTDYIDRMVYTWQLVDHEFRNEEIDSARIKMVNHAKEFASELSRCTHQLPDNPDKYEIPAEWKIQDYENYQKILNMIYAYRELFVQAYDDFVRIARSKLTITI